MPRDALIVPHHMDSIVCYGKVPAYGDFVSLNAGAPVVRAYDDWVRRGLYLLAQAGRGRAEAAFDASASYGFCYTDPASGAGLTGLMTPSRDLTGRRFPLMLGSTFAAERARFERLPQQMSAFLSRTRAIADELQQGRLDVREIDFDGLAREASSGSASAPELGSTTIGHLAAGLWSRFDDPRKYVVFRNLRQIIEPLRGQLPAGYSLAFRFPIRRQHASEDAAFWLAVLLRLVPAATLPSFFWTHAPAPDRPAFLLVSLRQPGPGVFVHLIDPDEEGETICNLEAMGYDGVSDAGPRLPADLENLLDEEQLTLDRFLDRLT